MAVVDDLLEAERRGLLPPDKLNDLQEARKRGLVPPPLANAAQQQAAPQAPTTPPAQQSLMQRWTNPQGPSFSDRWLTKDSWLNPEAYAPVRAMQSATAPFEGVEGLMLHGASFLASGAGYYPNAVSRSLGNVAKTYDESQAKEEAWREKYKQAAGIAPQDDYASVIGNVASPMTLATGEAGAAAQGAGFLSRLVRAGAAGTAMAAEQPVYNSEDYWGEKGGQAALGALFGGAGELGASTVAPWMRAQAQHLVDRYGIRVPFLSSLGPFRGRVEQISQSVPGSGMAVRGQFDQATDDVVRAAYNETLDPIRQYGFGGARYTPASPTEPGREMAREAAQAISNSYDAVIPRLQSTLDAPFIQEVGNIRASLPERVRGDFDDALQRHIYNYAELGQPGTAPTAPPRFQRPQSPGAQGGYNIQMTLQRGQQPGEMAAQGSLTRPPPPPRATVPTDPARAQLHAQNLQGSGADPQMFGQAMEYLLGDRGVRRGELEQVFQAYTGRAPGRTMTVQDMQDGIRQEFQARQTQSPFMLNGQNAKNADMGLRDEARSLIQNPSGDYYQRDVGRALNDVRDALRDAWARHSPQDAIDQLNATDLAYRRNMILNRAASSSASPEGRFGPTQLWQAVKAQDPTLGKRATAQGVAELQDLADSAKTVLGKTVADSGTPERGAAMWAAKELGPSLVAGGAAMSHAAPVIGTIGGHALAYSNPVQALGRFMANAGAQPREQAAGFLRTISSPGIAALSAANQPYDNKPRSVREWQQERLKRQQAAQAAGSYYGQ